MGLAAGGNFAFERLYLMDLASFPSAEKDACAVWPFPFLFYFWPVFCRVKLLNWFEVLFFELLYADVEEVRHGLEVVIIKDATSIMAAAFTLLAFTCRGKADECFLWRFFGDRHRFVLRISLTYF